MYGYLGFLLTLGVLPVYALTESGGGALLRRASDGSGRSATALLPLAGTGLMLALLVGQIVEQTAAPYTWLPWAIVGWVAAVAAVALWLARKRPDQLRRAGALLAAGEPEPVGPPRTAVLAR